MNCVMCGRQIADTAKFCPYCGVKVEIPQKPEAEKEVETPQEPEAGKEVEASQEPKAEKEVETPQEPEAGKAAATSQKQTPKGNKNAWQMGLFALAGVCGVLAFQTLLSVIENFSYGMAWRGMGFLLEMAGFAGMAVVLVMLGISKGKDKMKTLFLALSGLAIFMAVCGIIHFISSFIGSIRGYYFSFNMFLWIFSQLVLRLVAMAALVVVTYTLLQAVKEAPDLSNILKSRPASGNKSAAAGTNDNSQRSKMSYSGQSAGANVNNQRAEMNNYSGQSAMPLKTDRGLIGYILLSILTCGIYSYYFIYTVARDVNIACTGDGKSTGGLLKFILLSILTCGIYSWWWEYSLGNRLAENAPRYGMSFTENGTTVLMWLIFGMLLCGIGPYIAMNIIIKNTNSICMAYNRQNGFV